MQIPFTLTASILAGLVIAQFSPLAVDWAPTEATLGFVQLADSSNETIDQFTNQIAASDWLGPLAPVALSPFFGLAMLTGAATYGPEWLTERTGLLGSGGGFDSPTLFWVMVTLAVVSSLPRLSKLSKPLALACENLETYSSIIILLCIRMFVAKEATVGDEASLQAGLPADVLISIAVALNVIIINAVKLFFEFLIWLVPFPSVDAVLEAGNKLLCAGLMGLYMFSPTLATILNLALLFVCVLVFGWVRRKSMYYRNIIAVPLLERMLPNWFAEPGERFTAFLREGQLGLPKCSRVTVDPDGNTAIIEGRWWFRRVRVELTDFRSVVERGLLSDTVRLKSSNQDEIILARRKSILTREPTLAMA